MSVYTHKKTTPLRIIAKILRGIVGLFSVWPLLLAAAFVVFPISPHLRWQYTYRDFGAERVYYHCTYLGAGGFVEYMRGDTCPFITLINRKPD